MQVGDVTKNERLISKTYNSMAPIIWLLKIFAINANVRPTRSKAYVIIKSCLIYSILASISAFSVYYKIKHVYNSLDVSIRLTDMIQMIVDVCQFAVDLIFVYKYGSQICVEYFKQYEKIDNFFNKSYYYTELKKKLMKIMTLYTIFWTISALGDLGAWVLTFGWVTPATHAISYVFLFIKMLTTLDFIAHVTNVEARLRLITNFLLSCYSYIEVCPVGQLTDCVRNKNWLYREADGATSHTPKERAVNSFEIRRITKCYLLLTEQVIFINKMYGFRILLNTLNVLLDMVKILNLAIRIAIGSQQALYHSESYNYLPGLSGLMRFITCAVVLTSLVYQCEQAYQQREQVISVIDHLLINKNPDLDLRTAICDLRTLLQDRPICFNMENFFTLNYSLLVSISSVVVTYTIILFQNVK
ncbi:hypothetical protein PYW07_004427 [Mythimna separata]|uniref:Gustatory receptor n=1 Tax=Mythimna separata TaxID=271217 RepID=A0AAD8DXQ6_MYTSE|nr:hypothetical protein PYW07_004427 [Mythimna separata]